MQNTSAASGSAQQRLGEDISFGMQQTLACFATDFIDPFVAKWFQDKHKTEAHHSTLGHNLIGEVVGDTSAIFMFLGVQKWAPGVTQALKGGAMALCEPLYAKAAKNTLKPWQQQYHIAEDSAEYQQKLREWKEFQADNFDKSTVIAVSSIAANVATQKAIGNTHTLSTIAQSKIIGASITTATMLGLRFLIPKSTAQLDEELAQNYFAPIIRHTQKLMGAKQDTPTPGGYVTHAMAQGNSHGLIL